MSSLAQRFDQFLRERNYVHNVTPKTRAWYLAAWPGAAKITKPDLQRSTLVTLRPPRLEKRIIRTHEGQRYEHY